MLKTMQLQYFDATLDTDRCSPRVNADLTLTLRLGFEQVNPPNGAATGRYHDYDDPNEATRAIVPWDPVSWTAWKENLRLTAERFWSGKFWYLNNKGVFPFKTPSGIYIPNIDCNLKVICTDSGVGFHHTKIKVVRLAPHETVFNSDATLFDSLDNLPVTNDVDANRVPIQQVPSVHEIGHLLRLGHVDIGKAHCPVTGDTNASQCYGVSDHDKNSVMGLGMQVRPDHSFPWLAALELFRRQEPPSTFYAPAPQFVKPFEPYLRAVYPRTIQEFEAGAVQFSLAPGR